VGFKAERRLLLPGNDSSAKKLTKPVSRLVREALSFSKKLANHIGAIKLFICHYSLTKAAA